MKKIIVSLSSLALVVSLIAPTSLAQYASPTFQGSTPYQSGMSLDEAQGLAAVSQADAIALAAGASAESATAEITVVDGFLVWAVTSGDQVTYVDINNPEVKMAQQNAPASTGMNDEYEDDDDYEDGDYEDDDDYEEHDESEEHGDEYDSDEEYDEKDSDKEYKENDSDEEYEDDDMMESDEEESEDSDDESDDESDDDDD